jgi:hypothetical protein
VAIILWLFVITLGIAFGAGLYESRIAVPLWLRGSRASGYRWDAAAARDANAGVRFWAYVTTGPLTLLTLTSLFAAWRAPEPVRQAWLIATAAALIERVMTFAYFVPTMITLMREGALSDSAAVAKARQWVALGVVRHAATLVAWLAALAALSEL